MHCPDRPTPSLAPLHAAAFRVLLLGVLLLGVQLLGPTLALPGLNSPLEASTFLQPADAFEGELPGRSTLTAVTPVAVDFAPLLSGVPRLEIPLPAVGDEPATVLSLERSHFEVRGPGRVVWRGRSPATGVDGEAQAVLTVHRLAPPEHAVTETRLAGWLRSGDAVWTLAPTATGHRLARVVPRAFPSCGGSLSPPAAGSPLAPLASPGSAAGGVSLTDPAAGSISRVPVVSHDRPLPPLDVLVLYTPEARQEAGGRGAIETLVQNAVDLLNTAFTDSEIPARARLVGTRESAPSLVPGQPPMGETLRKMTTDPTVQQLREELQADMVSLWVAAEQDGQGTLCGIAWAMGRNSIGVQFQRFPMSVTRVGCAVDNMTFPHELGHNLGGFHEPQDTPRDEASFPWSFGHTEGRSFRTILATGTECPSNSPFGCPRIPHFSNPAVERFGLPTGVAGDRDLHRTFGETIPVTARFRGAGSSPPASPPAAPTDLRAEEISATAVSLVWTDRATDETGYWVNRAVGAEPFRTVQQLPAGATTARVEGLLPGTAYRFLVVAAGDRGSSLPSNLLELVTLPRPPEDLRVDQVGETTVGLSWNAVPNTVTRVERSSPRAGFREVATVAVDTLVAPEPGTSIPVSLEIEDLDPETPYTFRARTEQAGQLSDFGEPVSVTTAGATGPCRDDGLSLCLLGERFEVRVAWRNPRVEDGADAGGVGRAVPVAGSEISGLFWFFRESNIELIVKMLDGTDLNGFVWHFWGALTDVEYWISVRDTETGAARTFHNPPFEICGGAEVEAFARGEAALSSALSSAVVSGLAAPLASPAPAPGGTAAPCVDDATTLCLADGRFRVEVDWANPRPPEDSGTAGTLPALGTGNTGLLWFFQPENVELVVKILDARSINGHFWLFWGALTDVRYTLRVTDTEDGSEHVFENPAFEQCGGAVVEEL